MQRDYRITSVINDLETAKRDSQAIARLANAVLADPAKMKAMIAWIGVEKPIEIETILNSTQHILDEHQKILQHILENTAVKWPPDTTMS